MTVLTLDRARCAVSTRRALLQNNRSRISRMILRDIICHNYLCPEDARASIFDKQLNSNRLSLQHAKMQRARFNILYLSLRLASRGIASIVQHHSLHVEQHHATSHYALAMCHTNNKNTATYRCLPWNARIDVNLFLDPGWQRPATESFLST